MLKLRLPYFGHLMQRNNSLKKILMLGKVAGRRRGLLKMRYLDSITNLVDMSLSKLWEMVKNRGVDVHILKSCGTGYHLGRVLF